MSKLDVEIHENVEDWYLKSALMADEVIFKLGVYALKPSDFRTEIKRRMFRIYQDFFLHQKEEGANSFVLQESQFKAIYSKMYMDPDTGDIDSYNLLERYIKKLHRIDDPPRSWSMDQIVLNIRHVLATKAVYEAAQYLNRNDVDKAMDIVQTGFLAKNIYGSDLYPNDLDLSEKDILELSDDEQIIACLTGINALDKHIGGFRRENLHLLMASTNVGKSWASVHFACQGVIMNKKVLYCTLEISKKDVLRRVLSSLLGIVVNTTDDRKQTDVQIFQKVGEDFDDKKSASRKIVTVNRRTLNDASYVKEQLDEILEKQNAILKIHEFAAGEAKVDDIAMAIERFTMTHESPPDLIIVDSLNDFQANPKMELRHDFDERAKKLRAMAQRYKCAVFMTAQLNRQAKNDAHKGNENIAESMGPARTADSAWVLDQTAQEQDKEIARIIITKSRSGKAGGSFRLHQNYGIGQFCQFAEKIKFEEKSEGGKSLTKGVKIRNEDD